MKNRKLIAGTLAGIVGLGTYLQFGRPSIEGVVKREFDSFPTEIEGAKSVKKYETEGAKYCLVHVRQSHGGFYSQASESEVTAVQNDVYNILSHLVESKGLKEVYLEGIDSKSDDLITLANIKKIYNNILDAKKQTEMKNKLDNAVLKLFCEGRLNIKPAEKHEIYTAMNKAFSSKADFNKPYSHPDTTLMWDNREDALLDILTKDDTRVAVTIYGGSHYWLDNVQRWNMLHPEKKFSLIEVTPENAPDYSRFKFVKNNLGEIEVKSWRD